MDKDSVKVKGENALEYAGNKEVEMTNASYWCLMRSYLLLHHSEGFALYEAEGIGDSNDFLHYSYAKVFKSMGDMVEYCKTVNTNTVIIRIVNGVLLD